MPFGGWVILGYLFFVCGPLAILFLSGGQLSVQDDFYLRGVVSVNVDEDFSFLMYLLICGVSIIVYTMLSDFISLKKSNFTFVQFEITWQTCVGCGLLFIIFGIARFYLIGLNEGGHWHENLHGAMEGSDFINLIVQIVNFIYLVVRFLLPALIFHGMVHSLISRRVGYIFLIFAGLADAYLSGNRITLLICISILSIVEYRMRDVRYIAILSILIPVIMIFSSKYGDIRIGIHDNVNESAISSLVDADYSSQKMINVLKNGTESDSLNVSASVFDDFGTRYEYLYGATYFKALYFWVPRYFWPEKPDSFAIVAGKIYGPTTAGLSLNSTIFGEGYANFGIIFPIFFLITLVVIGAFFSKYSIEDRFSYVLMPFSFTLIRFDLLFFIWGSLASIFIIWAINVSIQRLFVFERAR